MKYFELEQSEEELLRSYEKGEFKSVSNVAVEKERHRSIVATSLKKSKNVNIRLSEHDLLKLKARALEDGIPYQTYLASLVHKHVRTRRVAEHVA